MDEKSVAGGADACEPAKIDPTDARMQIQSLVSALRMRNASRELSLAITNLQQAFFWLDEVNRLS